MSKSLFDYGSCLRLVSPGEKQTIEKDSLMNIIVVGLKAIRIENRSPAKSITIKHEEITHPKTNNVFELAKMVKMMAEKRA